MNGCKNQVRTIYGEAPDKLASMGQKNKPEKETGGGRGKEGKGVG